MNYQQIVTLAGRAAEVASQSGAAINLPAASIVFGDGGGLPVTAVETQTQLVNQLAAMPVSSVYPDPGDPTKFYVECMYGDQPGAPAPRGYTIRECGIRLADGALFSVGAMPDTALPLASQGAALSMRVRLAFIITTAGAQIVFADNVNIYATELWVDTEIGMIGGDMLAAIANNANQLSAERVLRRSEELQNAASRRLADYLLARAGF